MVEDEVTALIGTDRENNPAIATVSGGAYIYDIYVEFDGTRCVLVRQDAVGFYDRAGARIGTATMKVQVFDRFGDALRYVAGLIDETEH